MYKIMTIAPAASLNSSAVKLYIMTGAEIESDASSLSTTADVRLPANLMMKRAD
jgi:hypothetical protein